MPRSRPPPGREEEKRTASFFEKRSFITVNQQWLPKQLAINEQRDPKGYRKGLKKVAMVSFLCSSHPKGLNWT